MIEWKEYNAAGKKVHRSIWMDILKIFYKIISRMFPLPSPRKCCIFFRMLKKILKWLPAIFIACCNFYLSSKEHIEHMPGFWNADKVVHFICFSGFGFWVAFACNIKSYKKIWIPALIIALWAITDEIHQGFTPGRDASVFDWLTDVLGAFAGSTVFVWFTTRILPKSPKKR